MIGIPGKVYGIKLEENIAAIGLELACRGKGFRDFYAAQREGWLGVTEFVIGAARVFTEVETGMGSQYDWLIAVETFVDRLLSLSQRRQLTEELVWSAASQSISAAGN